MPDDLTPNRPIPLDEVMERAIALCSAVYEDLAITSEAIYLARKRINESKARIERTNVALQMSADFVAWHRSQR